MKSIAATTAAEFVEIKTAQKARLLAAVEALDVEYDCIAHLNSLPCWFCVIGEWGDAKTNNDLSAAFVEHVEELAGPGPERA